MKQFIFFIAALSVTACKNNLPVRSIETDMETKEVKETHFTYKSPDKKGNPDRVYLSYIKDGKPYRIPIRSYEYY